MFEEGVEFFPAWELVILHIRLVLDVRAHAHTIIGSTLTEGLCQCVEHSIVEGNDVLVIVKLLGELCVVEQNLALTHDVVLEGIALELQSNRRILLHLLLGLTSFTFRVGFFVLTTYMLESFSFNQRLLQEDLGYI